jgi:hypothetical protein
MMSGNYHVEPISGNYKGVFGKDGEQLCAVYGWKSEERAALIVTAVNAHSFMTSTLIRAKKELIQLRESSTDKNFTDSVLKQIDKALRLAEGEKKCP